MMNYVKMRFTIEHSYFIYSIHFKRKYWTKNKFLFPSSRPGILAKILFLDLLDLFCRFSLKAGVVFPDCCRLALSVFSGHTEHIVVRYLVEFRSPVLKVHIVRFIYCRQVQLSTRTFQL